mmetsp:Transcript_17560/g.40465  ORF Transcript_17560/g.40465 Transcript_17560/m.40465 type:complete len:851 (-) Transcript_17560:41-2593(-)
MSEVDDGVDSKTARNSASVSTGDSANPPPNIATEDASTGIDNAKTQKSQSDSSTRVLKTQDENLDWVLTNYDQKNSEPQSLDEELNRLQALRSYLILDSEREEQFERLTALASRVMDVPIALVSLVDLGRQWFMSNRGLGDVRETSRSSAFCSHAILSKDDVLVIKDAKEDPRFVRNPLVTGPPFIRFYAGAPLETPEGYKVGTFCIIDTKPWPQGLSLDGKQNLREFAGLAVEVMISRRRRREREEEKSSQLIACAAHDLLTPLSGIELSLHLLKEDEDFQSKMAQKDKEKMTKVDTCSDIIQEICDSVRTTYAETKTSFEESLTTAKLERINISALVDKLYTAIEPAKSYVPVQITVDPNVPKEIVSDPSKIFRGALNYLIIACKRTKKGAITLSFFMKKTSEASKKSVLFVTCEDTAPAIEIDVYEHLFAPPSMDITLFEESCYDDRDTEHNLDLCLFSVACEMNVVGGEYGFRPRSKEGAGSQDHEEENGSFTGSIFWFFIPCMEFQEDGVLASSKNDEVKKQPIAPAKDSEKIDHEQSEEKHDTMDSKNTRKKRALVIEDSAIIRKMLDKILSKHGFEVSEAENGMQGLEKLKSTLFDITLCDFLMPIMDGLDCMQQYRDWEKYHRPWVTQRIVGISAHGKQEDVEKGLKIGMDDFRPKPITFKVISELIDCDKQREMSRRLDEIERREALITNSDNGSLEEIEKNRKKHVIDGRACTLLMISPRSEQEHTKLMQKLIKNSGWQTTTAQSEREALVWLKMRNWDLVLVDDSFAPLIGDFREWEAKKRQNRQQRITLMAENLYDLKGDGNKPIEGFDKTVMKPMGLNAFDTLLESTYAHLSQSAGN